MCRRDKEHLIADLIALRAVDLRLGLINVRKLILLEWITEGDGSLNSTSASCTAISEKRRISYRDLGHHSPTSRHIH
jgi:hypothetical protein